MCSNAFEKKGDVDVCDGCFAIQLSENGGVPVNHVKVEEDEPLMSIQD
jgi:hypothetical protein